MLFDDFFNRIVKYRKKLNQNNEISLEVIWPSWNKRKILGGNDATDNHRPVSQVITHLYLSFPSCLREVSDIFGPSSLTPMIPERFSLPPLHRECRLMAGCRR